MSDSSSPADPSPFQLLSRGNASLLEGDVQKAAWALDCLLYLEPERGPRLWQRGLACYYAGRFQEGLQQFESDMAENGSDVEEVIWHFLCSCKAYGFQEARRKGFLPLAAEAPPLAPPPPMLQVLSMFQGQLPPDDVISASLGPDGSPLKSYNDTSALPYANFYVGLYFEARGEMERARKYHRAAAEAHSPDYMGKLMETHYRIFLQANSQILPKFCLGNTYRCTSIIQGGWQFSEGHIPSAPKISRVEAVEILLQAYDHGIRAFDCGDIYTGVESIYGSFVRAHCLRGGRAEDIHIHTKLVPDLEAIESHQVDASYIRSIVRRSLNRIGVQSLSLVQFYWWNTSIPGYLDAARELVSLQREGLIQHIGLSNFDVSLTKQFLEAGIPLATTQVQYSVLDRRPMTSGLVGLCEAYDIKILAYGVLAGGFLTDYWLGKKRPSMDTTNRSLVKYLLVIDELGGWDLFQSLLGVLRRIADRHSSCSHVSDSGFVKPDPNPNPIHVSIAMVAICYVLDQKQVGGVIIGSHNSRHFMSTVASTQLQLTREDHSDIDSIVQNTLRGHVYQLEREDGSSHASIMKYNLNRVNGPTHLEELCQRFLQLHFEANPVEATRVGYRLPPTEAYERYAAARCTGREVLSTEHFASMACSYDCLLSSTSAGDIEEQFRKVYSMLQEAEAIRDQSLDPEQLVDLKIIKSQLNLKLVEMKELQQYKYDPTLYLPFQALNLLLPCWASSTTQHPCKVSPNSCSHPGVIELSAESRLIAILHRLRAIPLALMNGERNLVSPVEVLTRTAIDNCQSFSSFLSNNLIQLCKLLTDDEGCKPILQEISCASKVAAACILKYMRFLQTDALTRASPAAGTGKKVYERILKYSYFIKSSDELLALGENHFHKVKAELEEVAKEIDPSMTWKEITRDIIMRRHPKAAGLLDTYLKEIERARQHTVQKKLVSNLPLGEEIVGFYTPKFLVPFSPFGDFLNPSPFAAMGAKPGRPENVSLHRIGHLMLHSVEELKLSPKEEEKLLQAHDYTWINVIAPHESYPGHHVQALLAQSHPRILRRYYECTLFYEGWGLYTEELAHETGFYAKEQKYEEAGESKVISALEFAKLTRLTQLRLQLWRATRIILDVKLNTGQITFDGCRKFLEEEVMFNPRSSSGEVLMYTTRPGYASCYVTGFIMLMELRQQFKNECADRNVPFSLREFHDAVLSKGCIPFELLKELSLH